MTNLLIFILSIAVATVLVYIIYLLILTAKPVKKDLQITKKDILKQIEILYGQKKYDIVQSLASKYLEAKPNNLDIRLYLAKTLFNKEKIYEAIRELNIILARSSENFEAKSLLASCYKVLKQYSKAISEYREILKKKPDDIDILQNLGEIYLTTNQKLSAIKIYKQLEEHTESNAEALKIKLLLVSLYVDLEDYMPAFDELMEILESYPENNDVNKQLIELYEKVQNYEKAIQHCEKLLPINENNNFGLWILNKLVEFYAATKNSEKTLEYIDKLLVHPFSDKIKTKLHKIKILIDENQLDESLNMLSDLASKNETNLSIKQMLAKTYALKKDFAQAISIYKEILDIVNPNEVAQIHTEMSNLFSKWAMFLFDKGEFNECFKIFTLAIQYDEENPVPYYQLGEVNKIIKNFNEAISQFKHALQLDPTNSNYYIALAECYEEIDNIYEEKNALLAAIDCNSNNIIAHYKLAELYESQQDTSNEIESLKRVIQLKPTHVDAKYKLALIYERQGQIEESVELYEEILREDPTNGNAINNLKLLKEDYNINPIAAFEDNYELSQKFQENTENTYNEEIEEPSLENSDKNPEKYFNENEDSILSEDIDPTDFFKIQERFAQDTQNSENNEE